MLILKKQRATLTWFIILSGIPFLCGAQAQSGKTAIPKYYNLAYDYPGESWVRYLNYNKSIQTIDNDGEKVEAGVLLVSYCRVRSLEKNDDLMKLEFVIDSLHQFVETTKTHNYSEIKSPQEKPFVIPVNSAGIEKETPALNDLIFQTKDGSTLYPGQYFADFFPTLPAGKVSDGYTWVSSDTIYGHYGESSQLSYLTCENTIAGEVWYKGFECIKISSKISGTFEMKSGINGSGIRVKGAISGKREYYFHKSEGNFIYLGYLFSDIESSRISGTLEMDESRRDSFPITMTIERQREVVNPVNK